MCSQRYDEIVNTITGVIRGQYNGLVLPIVLFSVSIATVFAYLNKEKCFTETTKSHSCIIDELRPCYFFFFFLT